MKEILYDPPLRKAYPPPSGRLMGEAAKVVQTLQDAGHETYLVGGSIRDLVREEIPNDYDVASAATPEEVQDIFPKTVPVGIQFGTVMVLSGGFSFEVTTFRTDGRYIDGRRPTSVTFATVKEDVRRRDFTINGLLYDSGTREVVDYVGGLDDIERKVLRTIGAPLARFGEDRLRMLRAVRFAARMQFAMEPATMLAIQSMAERIQEVSAERIQQELLKILQGKHVEDGLRLLQESGLLEHILAPLVEDRTLLARMQWLERQESRDDTLNLSVLLLSQGAEEAEVLLRALRLSNDIIWGATERVRQNQDVFDFHRWEVAAQKRFLRQACVEDLLSLGEMLVAVEGLERTGLDAAWERKQAWSAQDLAPERLLTGNDLRTLGYRPGPQFKGILTALEDAQLEGNISTRAEAEHWLSANFSREG